MADNYIGNRMDDYRAGRLQAASKPRRLSPSGLPLGQLSLAVDPALRVWLPQGALTAAGEVLMRTLRAAAIPVSYRAAASRQGAALAMELGARHYPDGTPAPTDHQEILLTDGQFLLPGRACICFAPGLELLAAQNALLALALPSQPSIIHVQITP